MDQSSEEKAEKLRALGLTEERISELLGIGQTDQQFGDLALSTTADAPSFELTEVVGCPRLLYGQGDLPTANELEEIQHRFQTKGCVFLWSTVLQEKVAYVISEVEKAKVPDGFIMYTDDELRQLFGPDAPPIERSTLRLIHEAKRQGAVVNSVEWRKYAAFKG